MIVQFFALPQVIYTPIQVLKLTTQLYLFVVPRERIDSIFLTLFNHQECILNTTLLDLQLRTT